MCLHALSKHKTAHLSCGALILCKIMKTGALDEQQMRLQPVLACEPECDVQRQVLPVQSHTETLTQLGD